MKDTNDKPKQAANDNVNFSGSHLEEIAKWLRPTKYNDAINFGKVPKLTDKP